MYKTAGKKYQRFWVPLFVGLVLASALFFSACSGPAVTNAQAGESNNNGSASPSSTPTLVPSPTVSPSLQQQGTAQLQSFQQWIDLMNQYGGKVDTYQQQYDSDTQALNAAHTDSDYQSVLKTLKKHVKAIQIPALKTEAMSLQSKLSNEASAWEKKHTYHDSYDGNTYALGYEYAGVVNYPAQTLLDSSATVEDYQYDIEQLNVWLANFAAYKTNFSDKTPYNKVHSTDTQLIDKYGYTSDQVIVVSFSEQAMRIYQDGKLIKSFQIVSGMPSHPSLPGTWWVETRQTDLTFTSGKKKGEEGYYPPTPIAYALQYHSGGYYIHQSWWRSEYGKNMQFPHVDSGGTSFAYEGSHGCINMSTATVKWLYEHTTVNDTKIIMY